MDFEDELNPNNYSYPHFEDGNEQITQNLARLLADTTASSTFDLTSGAVGTSGLPSFISPTDSTGSPYLSVGGHDDDLSGSAMFGSSMKLPTTTTASLPATSKAKGKRKAKTQGEPKRASKKAKASARVPEPVGDVSLDVPLPNVGRVRLDKRSATSRTRSLDRPAIPTWLQETGVSEQRRAEINAVVMAAATPSVLPLAIVASR
jgi:hypothetical protein